MRSNLGQLFCTTDCQTSASRMLFAFSRDLVLALVRRIEVSRDGGIEIQFMFGDWRDRVASIERRLV